MKFKLRVVTLLTTILLANNFYFDTNAQSKDNSIPNRYETLEGEKISIQNSDYVTIEELEVFGNTVQNEQDLTDIKSVGDLYTDENGNPILDRNGNKQYKLNIVTQGKNLLDAQEEYDLPARARFIKAFELEPNTDYTFSLNYLKGENFALLLSNQYSDTLNHDILYQELVTNGGGEELCARQTNFITFNSRNYKYLYATSWVYDGTGIKVNQVQLEKGNVATAYESFVEKVYPIILPTKLEKVGPVSDKIVKKNNIWYVEKNIKDKVIDGTKMSNGGLGNYYAPNHYYYYGDGIIDDGYPDLDTRNVISSFFKGVAYNEFERDEECIYISLNRVYAYVHPSNNANSNFFIRNNVDIKYASSNPDYIALPNQSDMNISLFDDVTYISSDTENGIKPSFKVIIDKINLIAEEKVTLAETNNTEEAISSARYIVNQLKESILKDQLQGRLNSLIPSDNNSFNKLTATANVDVYIKTDNILSMSLNTNSVSFDNYSGVADVELKDAIEITVDSSLPYDINVSMPTEISNVNGSNKISQSLFNIKESNEANYQQFQNTSNKLNLKSNCDSGDSKLHKIDLKLSSNGAHTADIYKTVLKFEIEQK